MLKSLYSILVYANNSMMLSAQSRCCYMVLLALATKCSLLRALATQCSSLRALAKCWYVDVVSSHCIVTLFILLLLFDRWGNVSLFNCSGFFARSFDVSLSSFCKPLYGIGLARPVLQQRTSTSVSSNTILLYRLCLDYLPDFRFIISLMASIKAEFVNPSFDQCCCKLLEQWLSLNLCTSNLCIFQMAY